MWASVIFGILKGGLTTAGAVLGNFAMAEEQEATLKSLEAQQEVNRKRIKIVLSVAVLLVIILIILLARKRK